MRDYESLSPSEKDFIVAIAISLRCSGMTPQEVRTHIEEHFHVTMKHWKISKLLTKGFKRDLARAVMPLNLQLEAQLRQTYPHLQGVRVVRSHKTRDVATHAAEMLVEMLAHVYAVRPLPDGLHISTAGGHTLIRVYEQVAKILLERFGPLKGKMDPKFPNTINVHGATACMNPRDPATDCIYMIKEALGKLGLPLKFQYEAMGGPGIVPKRQIRPLKIGKHLRDACSCVEKLGIHVTSIGDWDGNSDLRLFLEDVSPATARKLEAKGVQGDLSWMPLGSGGPIKLDGDDDHVALTLFDLDQFPEMIARGMKIFVVCTRTRDGGSKAGILRLALEQKLVTHVAVDYVTGSDVVKLANAAAA